MTKENQKPKQYDPYKSECEMTLNALLRGNGNFIPLPSPLVEFMGLTNTTFLVGIIDHYNYLRKHKKVDKGELFYNATTFEKKWGITPHRQRKAIKELSNCCLLKENGRCYLNQKRLKIYLKHCYSVIQLAYLKSKNPSLWSSLSFKKLQKSTKHQERLKDWLKRIDRGWNEVCYQDIGDFSCKNFKDSVIKNLTIEAASY